MSLRGVLRGFGLKVGPTTPRTFEARVRELVDGHPTLTGGRRGAAGGARGARRRSCAGLEKRVRDRWPATTRGRGC